MLTTKDSDAEEPAGVLPCSAYPRPFAEWSEASSGDNRQKIGEKKNSKEDIVKRVKEMTDISRRNNSISIR